MSDRSISRRTIAKRSGSRRPRAGWRALVLAAWLSALVPVLFLARAAGQDDANETPLGDIARSLRQKNQPAQPVIDDDNLANVMAQAESRHVSGSALRYLMDGREKGFQVSSPDVTCSLSFSGNTKSLLSSQYAQMELPPADVAKIEGPATIEGDALTVSVFNGTTWHVSELAVAFTVVKKTVGASALNGLPGKVGEPDSAESSQFESSQVRPERKPDETFIYRMRAAAPPFSTTVFSAKLEGDISSDEEWHWAIVGAKGYPPQGYASSASADHQPAEHPSDTPSDPASGVASDGSARSSSALPQVPR